MTKQRNFNSIDSIVLPIVLPTLPGWRGFAASKAKSPRRTLRRHGISRGAQNGVHPGGPVCRPDLLDDFDAVADDA